MTSYVLGAHVGREIHPDYATHKPSKHCPFCKIVDKSIGAKAHVVYEDDLCIAFLDRLPMREGHTLLIPKIHCARISDLPPEEGAALGMALPKVTAAITKALDNRDLNIVLNQGYAQAVPHAHFHLIPAPRSHSSSIYESKNPLRGIPGVSPKPYTAQELKDRPPSHMEMLHGEMSFREGQLEHEDGEKIASLIRARL